MCAKVRPIIPRRRHTTFALTSGQGYPARPRPCKHGDFGRSREAQAGDDTAWPVARGGDMRPKRHRLPHVQRFLACDAGDEETICKSDVVQHFSG